VRVPECYLRAIGHRRPDGNCIGVCRERMIGALKCNDHLARIQGSRRFWPLKSKVRPRHGEPLFTRGYSFAWRSQSQFPDHRPQEVVGGTLCEGVLVVPEAIEEPCWPDQRVSFGRRRFLRNDVPTAVVKVPIPVRQLACVAFSPARWTTFQRSSSPTFTIESRWSDRSLQGVLIAASPGF